jgi:hypothetical protein
MDPQTNFDQVEVQKEPVANTVLKISLVILFMVFVGLGGFTIYSLNQAKMTTSTSASTKVKKNVFTITPTPTISEDPSDIDIGNVEQDLKTIETDVTSINQ